jgi:hypothetical protein
MIASNRNGMKGSASGREVWVRAAVVLVSFVAIFLFASCDQTALLLEVERRVDSDTAEVVATPVILPDNGTYTSEQTITISVATANADIHFTTDGSTPTADSPVYSGEVGMSTIGRLITVRAIAVASGMNPSDIAETSYTVQFPIASVGPAGGTIVYDKGNDTDGWQYIEAAPSDQSAGIQWAPSTAATGIQDTSVGSGRTNTPAIVAAIGDGDYAAKLCDDFIVNGFDDWFLPSKDTLDLLFAYREEIGNFTIGIGNYYWSSSEVSTSTTTAHIVQFYLGSEHNGSKGSSYRVRAVRSF